MHASFNLCKVSLNKAPTELPETSNKRACSLWLTHLRQTLLLCVLAIALGVPFLPNPRSSFRKNFSTFRVSARAVNLSGEDVPLWGPADAPLWAQKRGYVRPAGSHPLSLEALRRSFTAPSQTQDTCWARVAAALHSKANVTIAVIGGSSTSGCTLLQ
jgi:hypothetical protein